MRTPAQITPTVHTEGGEFRLDIVDDSASMNAKRWRIMLESGILHVILFDDSGNEYRGLQIERVGTTPNVFRNRDVRA